MNSNKVFDDLMEALNEVEEHQKGNIKLKSTFASIPDEEIETVNKFYKLSDTKKHIAMVLINELYQAPDLNSPS